MQAKNATWFEVPASEKDHIETWLTKTVGIKIEVPDLAASGYDFQGARLLVVGGKPVAQLLYTDTNGKVIAICGLQTDSGPDSDGGFTNKSFDAVDMVRWDRPGASYVLVGDPGAKLMPLAKQASLTL